MRSLSAFVLTGVLFALPAMAGNITYSNGRGAWQSTQCTEPTPPPSVVAAASESSGEDMNALVTQYNAYVGQAQAYMNCLSNEAQQDADKAGQDITGSAQKTIADEQAKVNALGAPYKKDQN